MVPPGGCTVLVHHAGGSRRTRFGFGDPKVSAIQLVAIELLDGLGGCRRVRQLDEGESPRTAGTAIGGKKHLDDLAHFREQCLKLALGRFVTEIPNKDS